MYDNIRGDIYALSDKISIIIRFACYLTEYTFDGTLINLIMRHLIYVKDATRPVLEELIICISSCFSLVYLKTSEACK